ncbi:MAG TPA: CocE/NonD family hydrolase [Aldersonia sp.]
MRTTMIALLTLLLTLLLTAISVVAVPTASAQPGRYTSQMLYFLVNVGPDDNVPCTIVGELFTPDGASATNRAPAILTTNGFGGSYRDQVPSAQMFASLGYVALAYSGLGFGGSTCKISLDDREYDGKAASQLVSFLGGADGIAFTDPAATQPRAVLDAVTRDSTDHRGAASVNDPRVGMVGGSYGGGIQFAAAAVDPRIDTIIPLITWNDLTYSLIPNGTGIVEGVSTALPGAAKVTFASVLFASGVLNPGVVGYRADPSRLAGCPNYQRDMCTAIAQATTTGTVNPDIADYLRHSSVATFLDDIRIPVLLGQGQQDTLFDLNEATATYRGLKQRGVPVKMIWHSWGHSHLVPAPGEFSLTAPDPGAQYETARMLDWMDHYLRDTGADTGPEFAYFRPWVPYTGNAEPAYATSGTIDVGTPRSLYLSHERQLVDDPAAVRPAERIFVTAPGGAPTGIEAFDLAPGANIPNVQVPGTQATWTSAPMSSPVDVVGAPAATLRVDAADQAVVFAQIFDVAPDGAATLVNGLTIPVRITEPTVPVTMPAFVHRFEPGHSVRFVVSGGNDSFRGGPVAVPVTIHAEGSSLQLPVTP